MKRLLNPTMVTLVLIIFVVTLTSYKYSLEEYSYDQNMELKSLKNLKADFKINAGQLYITAHEQSLASFNSTYSKNSWKADVKIDEQAGKLIIHQPEEKNTNMNDEEKNIWKIKLPKNLETDLRLRMGAGEGTINLNGANFNQLKAEMGAGKININLANTSLANLEVKAGVGALSVDLSGKQDKDLHATIEGGIGEIKLVLPRNVGVRVKVNGLGSIDKNDLKKQNGYYVNEQYGKSKTTIDITERGGLGSLELAINE